MSNTANDDDNEARFPANDTTPQRQAAFAEAERAVQEAFGSSFKLKDTQGNLLGPFGLLSYAPTTFLAYLKYAQAFTTLSNLTHKERELSILATVSVTKSAYILYAHTNIAISIGLSAEQAQAAGDGRIPDDLKDRENVVYVLALKIALNFGKISDESFNSAVEKLGRDGIAQLVQVVGGYLLGSVLVNTADVKVPTP